MFAYAMRLTCFNNITKIDICFFNDTFDFNFQYVIHFDRYLDLRTNTNNTDWNTCWLLQTLYWMWYIILHNGLCFVIELSISKVFPPFCRFNGAHFLLKICQRRNSEVWLFCQSLKNINKVKFHAFNFRWKSSKRFYHHDVQQTLAQNQLIDKKK